MPDLILVLGGTFEARELAARVPVLTSLAGRVREPRLPPGAVRVGGFGGVPGLVTWLCEHRPVAVVDATHPFAEQMSRHAVEACAAADVPLLRLQRPGWVEQPGDRWIRVPSLAAAAEALPLLGSRVLLTTGRQDLGAFAALDLFVVTRSVEVPEAVPSHFVTVLGRPPWSLAQDRALIAEHRIDVLVTKDSGGSAAPKLQAAREAAIPVVMVDRPPVGASEVVSSVDEVVAWLAHLPGGTGRQRLRR